MTQRNDGVYLHHIYDAISKTETYLENISYETFSKNTLIQDGVIRQIEIIGEATKNLSESIRIKYTNVPWKDIAGMRDKLIHGYFGIDIEAVWETTKQDLPSLKSEVKKALKEFSL
ncbi:MAG: nucleotidyltransferase [Candidatus Saganbacteria bacterium]|uniref:Nucleotidyltransferase n=1 Tax=Candidatus Saganbacteria bacterium TaxID=2575572 RepID=A0A833L0L6_UNCSA|nr:MAG: nucleotidyltransferase [Candidatus Saganbacteria bacterium]